MLDPDPNEPGAAPAPVDTGLDTTPVTATVNPVPVTATVNPAPTPAPAATGPVDTGFGDLGGTPAPAQQATPTVNTMADTGEDPDVDLDARVAGLLANKSAINWNAVSAFMANVVAWPGSPSDPGYVNLHYSMPNLRP